MPKWILKLDCLRTMIFFSQTYYMKMRHNCHQSFCYYCSVLFRRQKNLSRKLKLTILRLDLDWLTYSSSSVRVVSEWKKIKRQKNIFLFKMIEHFFGDEEKNIEILCTFQHFFLEDFKFLCVVKMHNSCHSQHTSIT